MCSHRQPGEPCAGEGDKLRLYLLRGAAAAEPFQGSISANFEVTLDFGLTGFSLPAVYVKFLLPKQLHTPILSRLCFSLCLGGGGGGEVEEMGNQACSRHLINELKSVTEPHCLLAKQNTL